MRAIGHFVGGKEVKGASGRSGDVFDPNTGEVQAKVAFAKRSEVEDAIASAQTAQPALGSHQPPAPRPRAVQVPRARSERVRQPGQVAVVRARQDHRRRQGRHPARARSGGVRLRHPAPAQRRVQRRRGTGDRSLLHAPAARRCRRDHAVQFSRHDSDVEIRPCPRLRQFLHPETVGARSVRPDAACRAAGRGGPAGRRAQRDQRRQGSGRRPAHRSARDGDRLRRLLGDRRLHLFDRLRAWQTRAMFRRRQEPHDRDAGRRHGPGGRRPGRRRLWLRRRTLHGGIGGGAGGQEDGRHPGREAHSARRKSESGTIERSAIRLRPAGHQGAPRQGAQTTSISA